MSLENNIVQLPDAQFYVPNYPFDYLQNHLVEQRNFFEQPILDDLRLYVKKDAIIFDIGANIGNHSVYFAKKMKAKHVFSFEPITNTYNKLLKNIEINQLNARVNCYNLGISDDEGSASICRFIHDNPGATSLSKDEDGDFELISLDSWVKANFRLQCIDFIKIDVEGFEKEVLKGAIETIKMFKPVIFIEIESENKIFINDFLLEHGYKLKKEYHPNNYLYI